MTIDERDRHELHNRLAEVLGDDEAATLMAHLPPGGWDELATKRDLEPLATKADLHEAISTAITGQTRQLAITIAGVSVAYAGLALGMLQAVRL